MTDGASTYGQDDAYSEAIDEARGGFSGDAERFLGRGTAGDGIRDALNQLSDEIEARPEVAAGIAIFAGLLLGMALGRPSRAVVYLRD